MKSYKSNTLYPLYALPKEAWLDRWARVNKYRVEGWFRFDYQGDQFLNQARALEVAKKKLSNSELVKVIWLHQRELRLALQENSESDPYLIDALASLRELSLRILGMRHHDVQLLGARAILMGRIAEMQTGEGKSLTAVPVAVIAAVAGFPIHIITVNEYLASRDAHEFSKLYSVMGLTVGVINDEMSREERVREYRKQIVYCTNKSIAFDYIKDRIEFDFFDQKSQHNLYSLTKPEQSKPLLRGLSFALIDEADSVLIDEARTPLIISKNVEWSDERQIYLTAYDFAVELLENKHFKVDRDHKSILWLSEGESELIEMARSLGGLWSGPIRCRELLSKALSAIHLYQNGKEYTVFEEKVQIIDEFTGRRMPDRTWEGGIHQFIELKENVELTPPRETIAQSTLYRFFEKYWRVSGMSGTINEVSNEVYSSFGVKTEVIPPHKISKRKELPMLIHKGREAKDHALVQLIKAVHLTGQPILIGTRSVSYSIEISGKLESAGITHQVLSALNDKEEADIISKAGYWNAVTVATNMAGRGTDIKLCKKARKAGGLHVIGTEIHESGRVDRQLFGRCARQGDPGSSHLICSFEDEIPQRFLSKALNMLGRKLCGVSPMCALWLIKYAQSRAEKSNYFIRKELLRMDETLSTSLSFAGSKD